MPLSYRFGQPWDKQNSWWAYPFSYVLALWLGSRGMIVAAIGINSLLNPDAPGLSWNTFSHWDSDWYLRIARSGYSHVEGQLYNSTAFFPLLPLLIRGGTSLGLPGELAGLVINNLAFLGALQVLYGWVRTCHSPQVARWATAVLAWCPLSLFGTVVYSEGLFLLFTTASLRAFDQHRHAWAAIWGALATATRFTGITLIPAFWLAALRERRGLGAYLAGLVVGTGLLLYSLYCAIQFGDPLAFIHAQRGWRAGLGFDWQGWLRVLAAVLIGPVVPEKGLAQYLLHLLWVVLLLMGVYGLWFWRQKFKPFLFVLIFCLLGLVQHTWLLSPGVFWKLVLIWGGGYLLWHQQAALSSVAMLYGFCSLGLILVSGSIDSLERYAYGIVSLAVAFGLWGVRYRVWGYALLSYAALILADFAVRFAEGAWVS
ncbi:mannosyltransferase family protein [Leptolyngbya sp. FACHB-261]|uniref:mannosyltransferase family protein n=1 Tax=Leptolyngbya sp. FACHB-261 TaxID=2692806 RepID=UPI001687903A|nr:mannosyltransferase family protein [Leptolyngbya sp. FACHB-261]MBD2102099.1 hypothetical protein [Leptolyngbya sp. FACHB-261]